MVYRSYTPEHNRVPIKRRNVMEHAELASKLGAFLAARDAALLREIYHDDAEIWHNHDNKSMTVQEVAELVEVVFSSFSELASTNIRVCGTEKGFVQQQDVVGTHINGGSLNFPACQIVTVQAGKISRLEEYFDPAPLSALLSAD
jgi:ketosteroid isomerase-like protein